MSHRKAPTGSVSHAQSRVKSWRKRIPNEEYPPLVYEVRRDPVLDVFGNDYSAWPDHFDNLGGSHSFYTLREPLYPGQLKTQPVRSHRATSAPYVDANRPRTGNPYSDGLVGVEPNPGPPKLPTKKAKAPKYGAGNPRRAGNSVTGSNFVVRSGASSFAPSPFLNRPKKFFLTSHGGTSTGNSHVARFSGHHLMCDISTDATGECVFDDGVTTGRWIPLNPRVCCQVGSFGVPRLTCPISMVTAAYRYFQFKKVTLWYDPLKINTASIGSIALAFVPDTSQGLSVTAQSIRMIECSAFGPIWSPLSLDLTPFLDTTKWYHGETTAAVVIDPGALLWSQGSIMIKTATSTLTSLVAVGTLSMSFEVVVKELAPMELMNNPVLGSSASSSSSSSAAAPDKGAQTLATGGTTPGDGAPEWICVRRLEKLDGTIALIEDKK